MRDLLTDDPRVTSSRRQENQAAQSQLHMHLDEQQEQVKMETAQVERAGKMAAVPYRIMPCQAPISLDGLRELALAQPRDHLAVLCCRIRLGLPLL